jgi:hypothetical protein
MKQWETKVINLVQKTDIEVEFNELGKAGWHFATLLATPFGVKCVMERETDRDVDSTAQMDELKKKFGM